MTPLGHCATCAKPCFQILESHVKLREPIRLGRPDADAVRVGVVLTDGSRWHLTAHRDCLGTLDLMSAWHGAKQAAWREVADPRYRFFRGLGAVDPARCAATRRLFASLWPIGILSVTPWSDLIDDIVTTS